MAPKKSVEEQRIDPDDGGSYTFAEMKAFYKGKYKMPAIQAYWDECAPRGASKAKAKAEAKAKAKPEAKSKAKAKAKAKAKEPAAEPKAKAKAKVKAKAKAKPSLKEIRKPKAPEEVLEIVKACKVIPVVKLDDVAHAVPLTNALKEGGINVSEITFRTDCAADCIKEVAEKCEGVCVGAGTVLNVAQVDEAIEKGADFIVSPGYDPAVASRCRNRGALYLPGVVTPTEVMAVTSRFKLKALKFFPAGNYGGAATLKSFSAVFPDIQFMPTGGVTEGNLGDFLSLPNVMACGGSWMANGADIKKAAESGDWSEMAKVAKSASELANSIAKK